MCAYLIKICLAYAGSLRPAPRGLDISCYKLDGVPPHGTLKHAKRIQQGRILTSESFPCQPLGFQARHGGLESTRKLHTIFSS